MAGKDGRGKMGEERRDVLREQRRKEASSRKQPGTGKVSKKAFLNDGLPYDFSKPGR